MTSDLQGVLFPLDEHGDRRTMPPNRAVWADAARAVDADLGNRIDASEPWRSEYLPHVRAVTELGARSADAATRVAGAGLAAARSRLVFRRGETDHPLGEGASLPPAFSIATETVEGSARPERELVVPYRGEHLRGQALRSRIDAWVEKGIIEPSAGAALEVVMDHPEWLRLDGRHVAVLGAGAETSPLEVLGSWGAEVLAIDLPRPALWERVLDVARRGAGRVHFPAREGKGDVAARAGANLITDVPETTAWLRAFAEDRPLVLGFYVYADGALHVQATMAADAVANDLIVRGHDVAVAYAGTPSDCYLVPPAIVEDSAVRRRHRGLRHLIEQPVRLASRRRLYADAYGELLEGDDGERWGVADALVNQQGPNYALAKRLQRWRTIDSWQSGRAASFNVAPPTWTASVTKNRLLAAGYHGAKYVGMEVFAPETTRTVMTALMVHDLHNPANARHPEARIAHGAVHGGYWRRPYEIRSTLMYTAALGLPRAYASVLRVR